LKTLTRGYTLAEKDNKIVKNVKELKEGDEIKLIFHDGEKTATCI
jgi:exonuclease VII large subunit